ncbi:MAG: DUF1553 domain-containing protein [Planctomycetes bacterium]|nr:DUF1553 domain-containing protein [Planctomycetota bacterium]
MRILLASTAACALLSLLAARALADKPQPRPAEPSDSLTALIDTELAKVWARDGIAPAAPATDEEFLRRVYLDTVGVPPTYEEATRFLGEPQAGKRAHLIDALLADERSGLHFANQWALTLVRRDPGPISGGQLFAQWMAAEINAGKGFDSIARAIVTAQGALYDNPAIVPYFADGEGIMLADLTGKLNKALRGVQVQCAQCHDHPYDPALTQKAFEGFASWFAITKGAVDNDYQPARAYVMQDPAAVKKVIDLYNKRMTLKPEQRQQVELYWRYIQPSTPDGTTASQDDPAAWRGKYADWLLADQNKQTRRYVANRMWSFAFGTGLVNPVDDFTPLNTASHPELLDALADFLPRNGWNLKALFRAILNSRAYQLSSRKPDPKAQAWHFAAYPVRQLSAEQFLGALLNLLADKQVQDVVKATRETALAKYAEDLAKAQKDAQEGKSAPNTQRYKYDPEGFDKLRKQFEAMPMRWYIARFGAGRYAALSQDDEMNASEGFTGSIDQALVVMNGSFTNGLAASTPDSVLGRVTSGFEGTEKRIQALYLHTLSRKPTAAELQRMVKFSQEQDSKQWAGEDILFALLMSTEFATNH